MAATQELEKGGEKGPVSVEPDQPLEVLPKEGFVQLIADNLLVGNYELAEKFLEGFKTRYGEIPEYLYSRARFFRSQIQHTQYYYHLKRLYFEFPVFMIDNREYETARDSFLQDRIEKAKVHWNLLINLNSQISSSSGSSVEKSSGDSADPDELKARIDAEMVHVIKAYKEVLEIEPMHILAIKGMLYCYNENGDLDEAETFKTRLDKAERYWGDQINKRSQNCLVSAKKAYNEKLVDLAIQTINLGLVTSPVHRDLLILKAEILRDLKKFREATACVDAVLRKHPNESVCLRMKKEIQSGRLAETLNMGLLKLREAEQKLPGGDLVKLVKESQECFFEVLDLEPENLKALIALYQSQVLTDNPIKAKKTLSRIREIDPTIDIEKQAPPPVNPYDTGEEPCFIATRLFGPKSEEVRILRNFRDTRLISRKTGRIMIALYKRIGPSLASLPGKGPLLPACKKTLRFWCRFLKG